MALKNFDKINREKREIQVGGEIADVTRIPSRVMMELLEAKDKGELSEENPDSFYKVLGLIEKICSVSNPKMTADFLIDNTDFEALIELTEYVMEPVHKKMEQQQDKAMEGMVPGKKKKGSRK